MSPRVRIFLDASVLVAAAGSRSGDSSAAIERIYDSSSLEGATSNEVLNEAERNVRRKLNAAALLRYRSLLDQLSLVIVAVDSAPRLNLPDFIASKDHHVVRACFAADAAICLTLDRQHLLTAELNRWSAQRGLVFATPGEFLTWDRLRSARET